MANFKVLRNEFGRLVRCHQPNPDGTWLESKCRMAAGHPGGHKTWTSLYKPGSGRYRQANWPRLPSDSCVPVAEVLPEGKTISVLEGKPKQVFVKPPLHPEFERGLTEGRG